MDSLFHIHGVPGDNFCMKTEYILKRLADDEDGEEESADFWPWLLSRNYMEGWNVIVGRSR